MRPTSFSVEVTWCVVARMLNAGTLSQLSGRISYMDMQKENGAVCSKTIRYYVKYLKAEFYFGSFMYYKFGVLPRRDGGVVGTILNPSNITLILTVLSIVSV